MATRNLLFWLLAVTGLGGCGQDAGPAGEYSWPNGTIVHGSRHESREACPAGYRTVVVRNAMLFLCQD